MWIVSPDCPECSYSLRMCCIFNRQQLSPFFSWMVMCGPHCDDVLYLESIYTRECVTGMNPAAIVPAEMIAWIITFLTVSTKTEKLSFLKVDFVAELLYWLHVLHYTVYMKWACMSVCAIIILDRMCVVYTWSNKHHLSSIFIPQESIFNILFSQAEVLIHTTSDDDRYLTQVNLKW